MPGIRWSAWIARRKRWSGSTANNGREYQPLGSPVKVNGHDFPGGVPKAIPYGVYDIGADEGWVSVGVDHETSAFAQGRVSEG